MNLPPPIAGIPSATAEAAFAPRVEFVTATPQHVEGMARKVHGKTACHTVRGELPIITPGRQCPRVGQEWQCPEVINRAVEESLNLWCVQINRHQTICAGNFEQSK